jgi:uncharacterized membrane protein
LWVDEAKLALNIVDSSFVDLMGPLLNPPQFAPIGFVLSTKLLTQIFFENEFTLRLLPLTSGIIAIFIFYAICKRILDYKSMLMAVSFFSISEYLIHYSAEFKQYSSDVFFSLLLVYLVLKTSEETKPLKKYVYILSLGFLGILSIFFSYPAAIILFVTGCYLAYIYLKARENNLLLTVAILSLFWFLAFLFNYMYFIMGSPVFIHGIHDFWRSGFLPFPPASAADIVQYLNIVNEVFGQNPLKLFYPGLIFFCFISGCIIGIKNKDRRLILIMAPIFSTIILSIFNKYPLKGRLILFLSPFLIILISIGLSYIYQILFREKKVLAIVLMILIFLLPVTYQFYRLTVPNKGEEIKEVLTYYRNNRDHDSLLYVYYGGIDAFRFYKKSYEIKDSEFIIGNSGREHWYIYNDDINEMKGRGKVWFLFSHVSDWYGVNEEQYFIQILNRIGKQIKSHKSYGAAIYLYEL